MATVFQAKVRPRTMLMVERTLENGQLRIVGMVVASLARCISF
jgi:hypothetical protein